MGKTEVWHIHLRQIPAVTYNGPCMLASRNSFGCTRVVPTLTSRCPETHPSSSLSSTTKYLAVPQVAAAKCAQVIRICLNLSCLIRSVIDHSRCGGLSESWEGVKSSTLRTPIGGPVKANVPSDSTDWEHVSPWSSNSWQCCLMIIRTTKESLQQ